MIALLTNVEFWKAFSAMLWPIVALVIFLALRTKLLAFFNKDSISIKVAGMEISVADVTKKMGADVADLQKHLAEMETQIASLVRNNATGNSDPNRATAAPPELEVEVDPNIKSFRILWADDYPSNNAFLLEQFKTDGIDVVLALTTQEAINAFQNDRFDLIITDLGRREDGVSQPYAGLALIKEIRKLAREIPVLVYAGQRGMENMVKLKKAGANFVSQSAVELQRIVQHYRQIKI